MTTITVGGLPGTGTSTLCKLLQEETGMPYVYAGRLFRDEARRRNMDLAAFSALCQEDDSMDRALDARQVEVLREGNVILEGRLAGHLAHRNRIHALKVWVVCDEPERIRRLVDREGGTVAEQVDRTEARQRSEADRYLRYYGIDMADLAPYDLVVDSTHRQPPQVLDEVLKALRSHELAAAGDPERAAGTSARGPSASTSS